MSPAILDRYDLIINVLTKCQDYIDSNDEFW